MDTQQYWTTVYRVENSAGDGVYRGPVDWSEVGSGPPYTFSRVHPAPYNDSGLTSHFESISIFNDTLYTKRLKFGFGSIAQLRAWFYNDRWLSTMTSYGYRLSVYSARGYLGNAQCMFYPDDAVLLYTQSLLDL